jgi:hypothetical protein
MAALYNIQSTCKTTRVIPGRSDSSEVRTLRMNFPKPSVGMLPNDRLDYSAITKRKPLKLPKGARMVVWTITNVE